MQSTTVRATGWRDTVSDDDRERIAHSKARKKGEEERRGGGMKKKKKKRGKKERKYSVIT